MSMEVTVPAINLSDLRRKRGTLKRKLTNFIKYLEPIQVAFYNHETIELKVTNELQFRTNNTETINSEFEEVQSAIECVCDDDSLENEYQERDQFTDLFSDTIANSKTILQALITKNSDADDNSIADSQHSVSSIHAKQRFQGIKLPKISLPTYKGQYHNWLEYKDIFDSLIHTNETINKIQKFHYLKASLQGEARKVIQKLEFSANNYDVAWNLLCSRYNNSRLLVHNHVKALFDMDVLSKETSFGLRNLIDTTYQHLQALQALKQPIEHWDTLLIYMISTKLDKSTSKEWEKHKITNELSTLIDLETFLKSRADWLETLEINVSKASHESNNKPRQISLLSSNVKCNYCKKDHPIYLCEDFLKLDIPMRITKVKENNLCLNCLRTGHTEKHCRFGHCRKCKIKHNSLLHQDHEVESQPQVSLTCVSQPNYVLLSTAIVDALDSIGNTQKARAIFDCGSQSNYISEKLCNKLHLQKQPTNIAITGINMSTSKLNSKVKVTIKSIYNNFSITISCFVLPKLTDNLPFLEIDIETWKIPVNVKLADKSFNVPSEVDILIGAGHFWNLLNNRTMRLGKQLPSLQETAFGWIVAGSINKPNNKTICNLSTLEVDLQRFWEIEECGNSILQLSNEDQICEDHFTNTFAKDKEGRFVVRLPFKHPPSHLGNSKSAAIKRLLHIEKRFGNNQDFKEQYINFMQEYIDMKHMTIEPEYECLEESYFLPHHGVLRPDSTTTKLRVVFDGSASTDTGYSLNNLLSTGPNILNNLFSILLRFRQHPYVVCADVEKMYRQILIHPDDRRFQKIVWRDNPNKKLDIYKLNTVTYGTSAAPFLAVRCIKQLAKDVQNTNPLSAIIIANDFYVDDVITGFNTEEQAMSLCEEISSILMSAHLPLRKWNSNSLKILRHMKQENQTSDSVAIGKEDQMKTLGIHWLTTSDALTYKIKVQWHFWSDSQIVLCWTKTAPKLLQTFVGNRIAEIQTLTNANNWNYVKTKENPADIASRGALPEGLMKSKLWFKGPPWLSLASTFWNNYTPEKSFIELPQIKVNSSTLIAIHSYLFPIEDFLCLSKAKRITAYCLRFIHNCKNDTNKRTGHLTVAELTLSMKLLVKVAQFNSFQNKINLLLSNSNVNKKSRLLMLCPFIDDEGLLRVGGRLKHSQLQFNAKHPLLLDGKHHLTKLILEHVHRNLCHAPPQLLLATIRQDYWPTAGIIIAKQVVHKCVRCFRFKPKSINPIMANLSAGRVSIANPFNTTGVDYAGPFSIKNKKGPGCKLVKAYICLFICFASKAIHLELVTDLTRKQLHGLQEVLASSNDEIANFCANEGTVWHFIPPNSPHFGGLWEAGVKTVKHHLFRAIGDTKFIYEEFNTILVQIEAIVNSRPLCALSSDPNDYESLTPAHFLIGRPLVAVPDPNLLEIPMGRLSRHQLLQNINQSFWKRWPKEYLSQLQQRRKWKFPLANLAIDTLVVIRNDNLPPCNWPLGRVVELHPDKEGVVRVVTIKTTKGLYKRAVAKVCPLPMFEK